MAAGEFADLGSAAHQVLEGCLIAIYDFGIPAQARDYVDRELIVEDGEHAPLSPSGSKRWMACAAAPSMEMKFAEEMLPSRTYTFDEDYAAAVQDCLDYVAARKQQIEKEYGPVTVRSERRVSLERFLGTDECDGTSDIALLAEGFAEHIDFKAGAGVPVAADDPQNQLYFLGTLAENLDDEGRPNRIRKARLTIVQPRCRKIQPKIRSLEIDDVPSWTLSFISTVRKAIEATRSPAPDFNPSEEVCRFCDARGACKAFQEYAAAQAFGAPPGGILERLDEHAHDFRDTRLLTGPEMRRILDARELLVGALQAVEAYVLELMKQGTAPEEVISAYKLVRGRTNRRWALEDPEIEKRLKRIKIKDPETEKLRALGKKDITRIVMKSAPQIEKLLKSFDLPREDARWDAFKALVERPEGALTIAPVSDPRPEVDPLRGRVDEVFANPPPPSSTPSDPKTGD